jgi:hypothetical protein
MSTEPKVIMTVSKAPTIRRTPDYKAYYSNQSRMRLGQSDIQLFFGLLAQDPGDDTLFNDENLSVVITPQHAKLLAHGLHTALDAYEAQFGEVKLPADAQKALDATHAQVMEFVKQIASKDSPKPPHGEK